MAPQLKLDPRFQFDIDPSMYSSYPTRDTYVHADQLDACIEQYLKDQKWFQELQASRKENWVPGSKGGYPDYYGG